MTRAKNGLISSRRYDGNARKRGKRRCCRSIAVEWLPCLVRAGHLALPDLCCTEALPYSRTLDPRTGQRCRVRGRST